MDANNRLFQLSKEQQKIFETLLTNLFDRSLEGLNETLREVNSLQTRHSWYHSNLIQIHELKANVTATQERYDSILRGILNEIAAQKQRAKEILSNALNQLELTINTEEIRAHLNELINQIDHILDNFAQNFLLVSIFGALGLFNIIGVIIALFAGSSFLGFATLGLGFIASGTASEVMFRNKLSELDEKLRVNIEKVRIKKNEQIQNLSQYFGSFEKKLHHSNTHTQTSTINIVWYDKQIQNNSNTTYMSTLTKEFGTNNYRIIEINDKDQTIEFIRSNIINNLILITSGSSGKEIVSQIGYYFHIKGVIIFCSTLEYHRTWAQQYKKVLLVTDSFSQVIQKIKEIESGEIYFLNFGFSFEDVNLKLQNPNYYLSTKQNGFIITSLSVLNLSIDYYKNIMTRLHNSLKSKNIYPDHFPSCFQIENLFKCAEKFVEALKTSEPEKNIIRLYTAGAPYYYKIINVILNLLDEELILLIQDYIKALRYSLIIYSDTSNKIPNRTNVKLYRGVSLKSESRFQDFLRKFKVNDTIVFAAFLSTSLNKDRATGFARIKGVLLDISADCTQSNKPKSVSILSHFKDEDEVLLNCFSLLTVKKITKINNDLMSYECTLTLY